MAVSRYADLILHLGHKVACVGYGEPDPATAWRYGVEKVVENVAIECETCNEVLMDFDRPTVSPHECDHIGTERIHMRPSGSIDYVDCARCGELLQVS